MYKEITKIEALKTIYYSEFVLSLFSKDEFIEYWMKKWKAINSKMDLLDFSKILIEIDWKREEIRDEIERFYNK